MTELNWDGKYKDNKRNSPVRIALPFQTIETINESNADRQKRLASIFNQKQEYNNHNRLIWGDKKYVLPSLLAEFAGKINLIYIDPPFDTGANFSFSTTIPSPNGEKNNNETFTKQPSVIEQKAYRDTWGKGLDSYLQWFYETALILRELLAENGSIYVHLDWHTSHYAKIILDEVFGYDNFRNEIIWHYSDGTAPKNAFKRKTDTIFLYAKTKNTIFNEVKIPVLNPKRYDKTDEDGKKYFEDGHHGSSKRYYLEDGMICDNVWTYITDSKFRQLNSMSDERRQVNYPTQKPEALLERIIKASSNEGDWVLDCFCGSGTTASVAEKLKRKWITCDLGRFAIHTARKRLLGIENVRPFIVQNLGKYERQQWMQAELGGIDSADMEQKLEQEKNYHKFILDLYQARMLTGYTYLHGTKAGRMVHIGSVDAPITVEDIKASIKEFWQLVGKEKALEQNGIDFLGWDFAFEVNETAKQFALENKVNISCKKIPREVLEKKAIEQGDIRFYELASLGIDIKQKKTEVIIKLNNFIIPADDVPQEIQGKITDWSQWIDYWSIDWNYKNDTFHNEWQSYRTKKVPNLDLHASHTYEVAGEYKILVKVIDILGNDTTKIVTVKV